jgi:stearoyl-CoA desaturase (delta-9 desaturase)
MESSPEAISASPPKRDRGGAAAVFSSPAFHRLQLRHFVLFDALPLGLAGVAFLLLPVLPPSGVDLVVLALLWLATGLGLTVGFHRLFAHQAFKTTPAISALLLVLGSMAARGPMISWVAMHRRHHQRADREGDLHSPRLHGSGLRGQLRGLAHAQLTWMMRHDYPNVTVYVPDLLREKQLLRLNRRYYVWVALSLALPTVVGALAVGTLNGAVTGFLWGGAVRLVLVEHAMSAVNSLCHMFGRRPYDVRDNSRNLAWLALPSWGEAFHNNHHAFPSSAAFGLRWTQPDLGYGLIRLLAVSGLAWDVTRPPAGALTRRAVGGAP